MATIRMMMGRGGMMMGRRMLKASLAFPWCVRPGPGIHPARLWHPPPTPPNVACASWCNGTGLIGTVTGAAKTRGWGGKRL
eukprot:1756259-Pyramimonas_sp.AAC.1